MEVFVNLNLGSLGYSLVNFKSTNHIYCKCWLYFYKELFLFISIRIKKMIIEMKTRLFVTCSTLLYIIPNFVSNSPCYITPNELIVGYQIFLKTNSTHRHCCSFLNSFIKRYWILVCIKRFLQCIIYF